MEIEMKRGRPKLSKEIKEQRKEEHRKYMKEYQQKKREIMTEEDREELKKRARELYTSHKEEIKSKKKEIYSLSKDATLVLRELYVNGLIHTLTCDQKVILDKFFNLPFKNI